MLTGTVVVMTAGRTPPEEGAPVVTFLLSDAAPLVTGAEGGSPSKAGANPMFDALRT